MGFRRHDHDYDSKMNNNTLTKLKVVLTDLYDLLTKLKVVWTNVSTDLYDLYGDLQPN